MAHRPSQRRAHLIDRAEQCVLKRVGLIGSHRDRLQKPQVLLVILKGAGGLLEDRVSGLPHLVMAIQSFDELSQLLGIGFIMFGQGNLALPRTPSLGGDAGGSNAKDPFSAAM